MKKSYLLLGASAAALIMSGCGTTTTIYDPATTRHSIRQEGTVSSEEFREISVASVRSALSSPKFNTFLKKYRAEVGDQDAYPVLRLDPVRNETDDPDLNVSELTDMINEALLNAGKVDVTMAEGTGRTRTIEGARRLQNNANFDQSTVAQRGTLQAARLVLRPKVISNTVSDDGRRAVVRTFVMEMADIKTGLVMWKYTKQLGFIKEKGTFGW